MAFNGVRGKTPGATLALHWSPLYIGVRGKTPGATLALHWSPLYIVRLNYVNKYSCYVPLENVMHNFIIQNKRFSNYRGILPGVHLIIIILISVCMLIVPKIEYL